MENLIRLSRQTLTQKGEVIQSVRNTHNGRLVSLADIVKCIQSDEEIKKVCRITRNESIPKDERQAAKAQLPCVEFSAICKGTHSVSNISSLTGYLCFDFDESIDYRGTREVLMEDNRINPVMIFTSPSGKLKVLLRDLSLCGLCGEDANEDYRTAYIQLGIWFLDEYGLKCDTSCVNADRCTYLSHDEDVFVNPNGCIAVDLKQQLDEEDEEVWQMIGSATVKGCECVNINASKHISRSTEGYDHDRYRETLTALKANLSTVDGEYVYDRTKRIPIGSRSEGNAVNYGFGDVCGWELKWRINFVAMFLFDNDIRRAQQFVDNSFDNVGGMWNRISGAYRFSFDRKRCIPRFDILLWIIRELGFKELRNYDYVTTIAIDKIPNVKKDVSITSHWDAIRSLYRVPKIFDFFTNIKSDAQSNDIILYSAINTLSAYIPNVRVWYNGKKICPNIYTAVLGEQATGKGEMFTPSSILITHLNDYCKCADEYEISRYNEQVADNKRCKDEGVPTEQVKPKLHFQNTISRATEAFFIRSTAANNHKLMYCNSELKDLYENNYREGGVVKTILLNVYDNHRIENNTNKSIEDGQVIGVDCPTFSCLVSSTPQYFDRFFELSKEGGGDGLISRFMTYSVKMGDYTYPPQFRNTLNDDEIEVYFLQWYFSNLYGSMRDYRLDDGTYDYVKSKFETSIPELLDAYADVSCTRNAIRGTITRYGCNVIKVATIIQSLLDFEDNVLPHLPNTSAEEYIRSTPTFDGSKVIWHGYDEFVERMRNDGESIRMAATTSMQEPFSLDFSNDTQDKNQPSELYITQESVDLADLICRPLLLNQINLLMAYSKDVEKNEGKSITDSNVLAKDTVLAFMQKEFTLTDYAKKYAELCGGEMTDNTKDKCKKWLKKLILEDKVRKLNVGYERVV